MTIKVTVLKRPPTSEKVMKQIIYGTAVGLTKTAKEGQAAVQGALRGAFTIRNRWPEVGPLAIKIQAATPKRLEAEVRTAADFLALHETGGTKTGRGGHRLAIPGEDVKRTKRLIIPKSQRPRAMMARGAFIIKTSKGDVIAIRQGRGKTKKLKFLYNLERSARIKKNPTFFEPIHKVINRRLNSNVRREVKLALQNMR